MNKKNPKGSGRKLKFSEPSEPLRIRVPASQKSRIRILFERYLKRYYGN